MPLAATRAKGLAFLISISGPGVSAAETTIDQTRNEMTMAGMPAERVAQIVGLLKLQYRVRADGTGLGRVRGGTREACGANGTAARHDAGAA